MIDWKQPIETTCGRPARLLGQARNGSIEVSIKFDESRINPYELRLHSNSIGQVHGGMYQLKNVTDESGLTELMKIELEFRKLHSDFLKYAKDNNNKAARDAIEKIKQLKKIAAEFERNEIPIDEYAACYPLLANVKLMVERFECGAIGLREMFVAVRRYSRVMTRAIDKLESDNRDAYLCAHAEHDEKILRILSGGTSSCRIELFEALFID